MNPIKEWLSQTEAAKSLNIHVSSINNCLKKGLNSTACGYKWKYKK